MDKLEKAFLTKCDQFVEENTRYLKEHGIELLASSEIISDGKRFMVYREGPRNRTLTPM